MNETLAIRSAAAGDEAAIARLLTQLNHSEGHAIESSPEALALALFSDAREVHLSALVAVQHNVIIGALLYYPGYDTLSASVGHHLADMVVDVAHRRAGAGKALMQALAQLTLQQNKSWVSLTALKENAHAQAFYTSLGMTRVNVDFFAIGKTMLAQM